MKTCIYAGSFDPITLGHLDIITRACDVFDKVVVAVAKNPSKKYLINSEIRKSLIEHNIDKSKVEVVIVEDQLIADYAYRNGIKTMLKGVRNSQDFDYERMLHEVSVSQQKKMDTYILISRPEYAHISSSAVKELTKFCGFIHEYVPINVKAWLEYINNQHIIGVTGVIGSGKSFTASALESYNVSGGGNSTILRKWVTNIDMDVLAKKILFSPDPPPYYINVREALKKEFNFSELTSKLLGDLVFNNKDCLGFLNQTMREPILTDVRTAIGEAKGTILLNSALLAEANMLPLCNNIVILTDVDANTQYERLKRRGMDSTQIYDRIDSQYSFREKQINLTRAIKRDKYGFECLWRPKSEMSLRKLFLPDVNGLIEPLVSWETQYFKEELDIKLDLATIQS